MVRRRLVVFEKQNTEKYEAKVSCSPVLQPPQAHDCPAPLCENMGLQEQKCDEGCDGAES